MPTQSRQLAAIISMLLIALWCCQPKNKDYENDIANPSSVSENIIEVETNAMEFQLSKKFKSGWKSTAVTTIHLDSGIYAMECYIRMPNGMAHAFLGMLEEVVVTGERNENEAPKADFEISVSSVDGISFLDTIPAGTHTFAVNFQDQKSEAIRNTVRS